MKITSYVQIKKAEDLTLDGVTFEIERRDGNIVSVTATDAKGRSLQFRGTGWDQRLGVFVPEAPKTKTVHVVTGKIDGADISKTCDTADSATDAKNALVDEHNARDVKIEPIEVLDDSIPF
jgi:hypothetical protein